MEEQLISFETAKLAKEKGFKYFQRIITVLDEEDKRFENDEHGITQSLLQKWIRETHKIYVNALPSYTDNSDNKKHYFELFYGKTLRLFGDKYSYFPTYEEALEVGLFEALNLIKNE